MTTAVDSIDKAKVMLLNASVSVAYVEAGQGAVVVFVHGSLCDYRYWKPQLLEMSACFRIITPSLSHYYPRLPSARDEPFTWRAHVEQITAFLKRLGPDRIHLVGHSRGACIAYHVALTSPGLVNTLTLVDPAGPNEVDSPDGTPPTGDAFAIRTRAVALIAEGAVDEGLKLFVDSTSRPGFWERSKAVFQGMARDNAQTLAAQLQDHLPPYRQAQARIIDCPALLVDGARSPAVYRDNAAVLSRWMPDSRRVTIEGASHGLTWSHSRLFDGELTAFLMRTGN
jgi:pimeloyl-ACP methyl ester carboxylesterase